MEKCALPELLLRFLAFYCSVNPSVLFVKNSAWSMLQAPPGYSRGNIILAGTFVTLRVGSLYIYSAQNYKFGNQK